MFASYFGGGGQTEEESKADEKPIILITGVTGFIGAQLLNHCSLLDTAAGENGIISKEY